MTFVLQNSFARAVGVLTGGTVLAQGITALALPFLTRLYTPADFDVLAVYTAVLGLLVVAACLRFNVAVPLPEDDGEAMALLVLALLCALVISLILAVPALLFPARAAGLLGQPGMAPLMWLIPLGVWLAATYDALQYWSSRKRRFGTIARTRITRALGGSGMQIGGGFLSGGPGWLIGGQAVHGGMGVLGLGLGIALRDRAALKAFRPSSLRTVARDYSRYPRLSVPEALLNAAGAQVPVLLIAAAAAGPEAGFLMLAMLVMGLPMTLVGRSIAQVFLAEAPARQRRGELGPFTRGMMARLLGVGGPLLGLAGLAAPFVVPVVFGVEWTRTGVIMAWLAPAYVLQIVASPVSMVLHVIGNVALATRLQLMGAVIRTGTVLLALQVLPDRAVEAYAMSGAIFYALYSVIILRVLGAPR